MKKILISIKIVLVVILVVGAQQSCTKLDERVYSDLNADKLFAYLEKLTKTYGVS